jgi:hypothetical protein
MSGLDVNWESQQYPTNRKPYEWRNQENRPRTLEELSYGKESSRNGPSNYSQRERDALDSPSNRNASYDYSKGRPSSAGPRGRSISPNAHNGSSRGRSPGRVAYPNERADRPREVENF